MWYLESKSRISNEIVPIIQSYINDSTDGYIEPFVGGANVIDKINCKKRIGCDIHKELIALLNYAKNNDDLPQTITAEEYQNVKNNKNQYPDWYLGFVGFCCSFGAKYFAGYARGFKNDNGKRASAGINALRKQIPRLKEIEFKCIDFKNINTEQFENWVIYCDIPYKNTTTYSTKKFDYDAFYKWALKMARKNTVLISEYSMPDEFECIWKMKIKIGIDSHRQFNRYAVEKLFIAKSEV